MKILVTGSDGFIGKNLIAGLKNRGFNDILQYEVDTDPLLLDRYTGECDFVYHLAGVNRPKSEDEFMIANSDFTFRLLESLQKNHNKAPVLMTSSVQAAYDNPYGKSKKAGEDLVFAHGSNTGSEVYVYRLPNVFGKWCRPNYNSAVATFCWSATNDFPLTVNDPDKILKLVYVDDVVEAFTATLEGTTLKDGAFCSVEPVYEKKVGEIADLIRSFAAGKSTGQIPELSDSFVKKLYSIYLSYLPVDRLLYPLCMKTDARGSFTEFIRSPGCGQFSVNIIKPGVTKGRHWHSTKTEKFMVVSGSGAVRLTNLNGGEISEFQLNADTLKALEIPPGYIHSITNTGQTNMVTLIWANEAFDESHPDTYYHDS